MALRLYPEARRWVDAGPSSPSRLRGEGHVPWATVRDTAEDVAAARGVSQGEVRGTAMVLDVERGLAYGADDPERPFESGLR